MKLSAKPPIRPAKIAFDRIDLLILDALRQNGRIHTTFVENSQELREGYPIAVET